MKGLMQGWPLTVDRIIEHAARWDGDREIVTRAVEPDASPASSIVTTPLRRSAGSKDRCQFDRGFGRLHAFVDQ